MAIFNVTNAAQLQSALSSAVGGDRIILASGNYGSVSISGRNYASNVTIQAASNANPAHFDGLVINASKNITIAGLDVGRALAANQPTYTTLNAVYSSTNIKMTGVTFHGSMDNDPSNDGLGLQVTGTNGFQITNSKFTELYRGIAIQQSSNVNIQSNDFRVIRSDGVVGASTDGITIDKNYFTDFRPVLPDHSDAIQFWNTGQTKGSSNITIKNNVLFQPTFSGVEGTGVQGIFISDPLSYGYKNVLIQNNLLYSNGAYNGLTVVGGTNVQIIGNSTLSQTTDDKQFWIRLQDNEAVQLRGNVTENIMLNNNTHLQDIGNINLAESPSLRSLIPNSNSPSNYTQLLMTGNGYQSALPAAKAYVSDAVGSSIGNMFSKVQGTSFAGVALEDNSTTSASTLDLSNLKTALALAAPVAVASTPAPVAIEPVHFTAPVSTVFVPTAHYDHFVAMP